MLGHLAADFNFDLQVGQQASILDRLPGVGPIGCPAPFWHS